MSKSELIADILNEILAQGEGRWDDPWVVLNGLNIWDEEDLEMFCLRKVLANVGTDIIEPYDAED